VPGIDISHGAKLDVVARQECWAEAYAPGLGQDRAVQQQRQLCRGLVLVEVWRREERDSLGAKPRLRRGCYVERAVTLAGDVDEQKNDAPVYAQEVVKIAPAPGRSVGARDLHARHTGSHGRRGGPPLPRGCDRSRHGGET
jgi:hypothetical protein